MSKTSVYFVFAHLHVKLPVNAESCERRSARDSLSPFRRGSELSGEVDDIFKRTKRTITIFCGYSTTGKKKEKS
jgi:hypothetical protein